MREEDWGKSDENRKIKKKVVIDQMENGNGNVPFKGLLPFGPNPFANAK